MSTTIMKRRNKLLTNTDSFKLFGTFNKQIKAWRKWAFVIVFSLIALTAIIYEGLSLVWLLYLTYYIIILIIQRCCVGWRGAINRLRPHQPSVFQPGASSPQVFPQNPAASRNTRISAKTIDHRHNRKQISSRGTRNRPSKSRPRGFTDMSSELTAI